MNNFRKEQIERVESLMHEAYNLLTLAKAKEEKDNIQENIVCLDEIIEDLDEIISKLDDLTSPYDNLTGEIKPDGNTKYFHFLHKPTNMMIYGSDIKLPKGYVMSNTRSYLTNTVIDKLKAEGYDEDSAKLLSDILTVRSVWGIPTDQAKDPIGCLMSLLDNKQRALIKSEDIEVVPNVEYI